MIVVIRQLDDDTRTLITFDNEGMLVSTQPLISLNDMNHIPYEKLIFILPGKQIRLHSVKVPTTLSQHDLQQAIPNIIEESFSEDIQHLHFSIGPSNSHHERIVGVLKKTLWKNLLHELALHDIRPDLILPDYLALPHQKSAWSLYYDDHTAIVQTASNDGFSADPALITTLLTLRFSESLIKPTQLIITKDPNSSIDLIITLPITIEHSAHTFENVICPQALLEQPPFNMLQNMLPKKQSKKTRSYWQWCGFVFSGFIIFLFVSQVILYIDFHIQSSLINRQITALSVQLSPNQDLTASQWGITQLLRKYERDPNPFLLLLEKIAPLLSHFKTIQMTAINYNNKKMTLTLSTHNADTFNALNDALSHAGLTLSQMKTEATHDATIETFDVEKK